MNQFVAEGILDLVALVVLLSGFLISLLFTALGFLEKDDLIEGEGEMGWVYLKFGSWFSTSPISDPMSDVDPNFLERSVLEFCLDPCLLPGLEVLGVLDTLGVRRD